MFPNKVNVWFAFILAVESYYWAKVTLQQRLRIPMVLEFNSFPKFHPWVMVNSHVCIPQATDSQGPDLRPTWTCSSYPNKYQVRKHETLNMPPNLILCILHERINSADILRLRMTLRILCGNIIARDLIFKELLFTDHDMEFGVVQNARDQACV